LILAPATGYWTLSPPPFLPILRPVSSQKYLNIFYRYTAGAVILLAGIGMVFAFRPKVTQFKNYRETRKDLAAEIRAEEERIKTLRLYQKKFHTDKRFVQKIAHETDYAHEGEVIFQFNDSPSTNDEAGMKKETQ